jgi:hypothetical protein
MTALFCSTSDVSMNLLYDDTLESQSTGHQYIFVMALMEYLKCAPV